VGLTEPEWTVDPATLAGSDDAWLRDQASDGFNATAAVVGPFTIARHAPTVRLADPTDGQTVERGRPIMLRAAADDLEDGQLGQESIVWSSDRDGLLGTGDWIVVENLSEGTHVVTVTVTDSDGEMASAVASVVVSPAGASPAPSADAPQSASPQVVTASPSPVTVPPGSDTPTNASTPLLLAAALIAVAGVLVGVTLYRRRRRA
jgi:hypothetical protein